jgi:hypothetical protein
MKTHGRRQPNEGEADMALFIAQLAGTTLILQLTCLAVER